MNGVVYSPIQAIAKVKLQEVIKDYARIGINPIRQGNNNSFVYFDNGDIWRAVQANDNARGFKWNVAYIDADTDRTILNQVILPCGIRPPYRAINWFNVREDNVDNMRGIFV